MANDEIELDLGDFDDLGLDLSDLDTDSKSKDPNAPRDPVTDAKTGFLKGLKASIINPKALERAIEAVVPDSYNQVREKSEQVVDSFRRLGEDVRKDLNPELKRLKKITTRGLPIVEKYLPKGIREKLTAFGKDEDDYGAESFAKVDPNELRIQNSIASIFNSQEDQQRRRDALEKVEMLYKEKRDDLRTKATISVQSATQDLIGRQVAYQDTITANYQKQSLELQFRQYFVAKDLFDVSQAFFKDSNIALEAITKNTALPDVQKVHSSEVWKGGIISQFFGSKGESIGDIGLQFWNKTFGNIENKIKDKIETMKSPLEMIMSAGEQYFETKDMLKDMGDFGEEEETKETIVGKFLGTALGEKLQEKIIEPVRAKVRANEDIQKGDVMAKYILENAPELLKDAAGRTYDNWFYDFIADQVYDVLESSGGDRERVDKRLRTTGLEATVYDIATRRSIVEVIPGFLSRIHQGIVQIATGEKVSRLVYDSKTEDFKTLQQAGTEAREEIVGEDVKRKTDYMLAGLYETLDKENKLSDSEKEKISRRLLDEADKGNKLFDPTNLYQEDWYDEAMDPMLLYKIKTMVQSNYDLTDEGGLKKTDKDLLTSSRWFKGLSKVLPNAQDIINQAQAFGESDVLRKTGLIDKDEQGYETFSHKKMRDILVGREVAEGEEGLLGDNIGGRDYNAHLEELKESIKETNRLLGEIKTLNEDCCFNVETEFKEIPLQGFENTKELLLGLYDKLIEIKDKEITVNVETIDPRPEIIEVRDSVDIACLLLEEIRDKDCCPEATSISDQDDSFKEDVLIYLKDIKTLNEDCCFNVETEFKEEPDKGFNNTKELLLGLHTILEEIKENSIIIPAETKSLESDGISRIAQLEEEALKHYNLLNTGARSTLESAKTTTTDLGKSSKDALDTILELTKAAADIDELSIEEVSELINGLTERVSKPVRTTLQGSLAAANDATKGTRKVGKEIFDTGLKKGKDIVKGVRDIDESTLESSMISVYETVNDLKTIDKSTLLESLESTKGTIKDVSKTAKPALGKGWEAAKPLMQPVRKAGEKVLKSVSEQIPEPVKTATVGVRETNRDAIESALGLILESTKSTSAFDRETIETLLESVISTIADANETGKTALEAVMESTKNAAIGTGKLDSKTIEAALKSVRTTSESGKAALMSAVEKAKGVIKGTKDLDKEELVESLEVVLDSAKDIGETGKTLIGNAIEKASKASDGVISKLNKEDMAEGIDNAKGTAKGIAKAIKESGESVLESTESIAKDIEESGKVVLESAKTTAKNTSESGKVALEAVLESAKSAAKGIGGDKDKPGVEIPESSSTDKEINCCDDLLEILDMINKGVWATVVAVGEGGEGNGIKGDIGIKALLKKSLGGLITGTGALFGGYGKALGGVGSLFKAGAQAAAKTSFISDIQDIYVKGEEEPRLKAKKLRKAKYINVNTDTPVQYIKDITGAVIDTDNNMEMVITEEDFVKGFFTITKTGMIASALSGAYSFTKAVFGGYSTIMKVAGGLAKRIAKTGRQLLREIKGIKDIYVGTETEPRILGIVLRRGGYFSATTGKAITSLKGIDGPILDSTQKVILTLEDIDNLFDKNGKKIDIRSLSEKLLGLIGSGIASVGRTALKVARGVGSFAAKAIAIPFKMAGGIARGGLGYITSAVNKLVKKMGYEKIDKEKKDPTGEIIAFEQLDVLNKIYQLLNQRIPFTKKMKRGSWQEQLAEAEEEKETKAKEKKQKRKARKDKRKAGGIPGVPGGSWTEEEGEEDSSWVDTGAKLLAGGGIATYMMSKLAVAGTALKGALGFGTATGAGTGLGAMMLPLAIPLAKAAVVAAVGYGIYKGVKYFLDRRDPKPIEKLRMLQYGVLENETDRLSIIRKFEDEMFDEVGESYGQAVLTGDAKAYLEKYAELFEIDLENAEKCTQWLRWYGFRFNPVFIKHMTTVKHGDLDEPNDIEDENNVSKVEYIKRVTVNILESAYKVLSSPFGDGEILVESHIIKLFRDALIEQYGGEEITIKKEDILAVNKSTLTRKAKQMIKERKSDVFTEASKERAKDKPKPVKINMSGAEFLNKQEIQAFRGEKISRDTRTVGLIEKYRMLQYGINPNDDFQLQPVRYLEKMILKNIGSRKLCNTSVSEALQMVYEAFPEDITNSDFSNAFSTWYRNRFRRVFMEYLNFMEEENIKDIFVLENVIATGKLKSLLSSVHFNYTKAVGVYFTLTIPFGNYQTPIQPLLIRDYEEYLKNLENVELTEKTILGFTLPNIKGITPEVYKHKGVALNQTKKTVEADINRRLEQEVPVDASLLQSKFDYSTPKEENGIALIPPVDAQVSSNFGVRKNPFGGGAKYHKGVDFAAPEGTPIKAAANGKMIRKDYSDSFGNVIYLQHKDGMVTKYAHMSKFNDQFNKNDDVKMGDIIGYVGTTGRSTGNHLHFELRKGTAISDAAYDPMASMDNGELLAANNVTGGTQTQVGGVDGDIIEAPSNVIPMEDFAEIIPKTNEVQRKQRIKSIEVQKQMENKVQIERLGEISDVLKNSLKVQIIMSEHLEIIKESINNLQVEETKEVKPKDEVISFPKAAQSSVIPKLSMRRKKF